MSKQTTKDRALGDITLLYVESDPAERERVSRILAPRVSALFTAADGQEGVFLFSRRNPDIVLAAAELPRMDGVAMTQAVRAINPDAAALLALQDEERQSMERAVEADASGYLFKPLEESRLLASLARCAMGIRKQRKLSQQQRLTELMLDGLPYPAMLVDRETGSVLLANASAKELGFAAGLPAKGDLFPARFLAPAEPGLPAAEAMRPVRIDEAHALDRIWDVSIVPVSRETLLCFAADITYRKQMEQALAESEETARALLNATNDTALLLDDKGVVLAANSRVALSLGIPMSELLGKDVFEVMPEDISRTRKEKMREVLRKRKPMRFEDSRDERVFAFSGYPVVDESGELTRLAVFVSDITDRKRAEEALRQSEKRYRAIVEDQTEIICRYDADLTIRFVNEAFCRYFGLTHEEARQKNVLDFIPARHRNAILKGREAFTPEHAVREDEHQVYGRDGRLRWMNWTHRAVFDEGGQILEFQSVGRDITEKKKAEAALRRMTREKERYRQNLEAIFQSIPDAILTVDTRMRVIEANKSLEALCGIAREAITGKSFETVAAKCCGPCLDVLRQTLQTKRPVKEHRVECRPADRPERVIVLNSAPLLDQDGRFAGAVLLFRDITRLAELEKTLQERHRFQNIVGKSDAMRSIYALLEQLAQVDTTVLITGESGTGKELVADALHYGGIRASGPLVKVNCSALSENLLESELFGHVRGAFTGATRDKVGRFQAAEGGTIFLDEIGDISPLIQLKLLRFLEQREFERVGDTRTIKADVRVLAATNVDLMEKVRRGEFREDLYYRLKVMVIKLPPLRERTEDIPLLAAHYLDHFRKEFGKSIAGPSSEVMRLLLSHRWPGNVRELKHTIEHACILCPGGEILPEHLPPELTMPPQAPAYAAPPHYAQPAPTPAPTFVPARRAGREDILAALEKTGWNKAKAARLLGISRCTLYRRMDRFGITGE